MSCHTDLDSKYETEKRGKSGCRDRVVGHVMRMGGGEGRDGGLDIIM